MDGFARVHKLTFKVGQNQLAVPIPLVPLPGELRQLGDCLQLSDYFDKIGMDICGNQYLSAPGMSARVSATQKSSRNRRRR